MSEEDDLAEKAANKIIELESQVSALREDLDKLKEENEAYKAASTATAHFTGWLVSNWYYRPEFGFYRKSGGSAWHALTIQQVIEEYKSFSDHNKTSG